MEFTKDTPLMPFIPSPPVAALRDKFSHLMVGEGCLLPSPSISWERVAEGRVRGD
jgi:hypothetical protein